MTRRELARTKKRLKYWRPVLLSDPCSYCGRASTEVDHIVPRLGRRDTRRSNMTAACRSCNCEKGHQSLLHFLLGRVVV